MKHLLNCSCMPCRFGTIGVAAHDPLSANKVVSQPKAVVSQGNLTKQSAWRKRNKEKHAEAHKLYMREYRKRASIDIGKLSDISTKETAKHAS